MVNLFYNVQGARFDRYIASMIGVRDELDSVAFAAKAHADALLVEHRHDGHAYTEVTKGKLDRYLVLNDERGQMAALSIEFGRDPYTDPETGETDAGMDGLYILHKATGARLSTKGRVRGGN
jgi:hypothetical protein